MVKLRFFSFITLTIALLFVTSLCARAELGFEASVPDSAKAGEKIQIVVKIRRFYAQSGKPDRRVDKYMLFHRYSCDYHDDYLGKTNMFTYLR